MSSQSTAKQNSTTNLTSSTRSVPWRVRSVKALPEYKLWVEFMDGLAGTIDMAALVRAPHAGVFAELFDPSAFAQVFVDHGAVTWPGEIDLAPDAMYAEISKRGEWVLR